jgi:hypothetical protein
MKKLIPVLMLSFCGSMAYSQSSSSDIAGSSSEFSFAEVLRSEIVTDIKKKLSTDTSMRRSNAAMTEFYKACGVNPLIKAQFQSQTARSFKILPENMALILADFSKIHVGAQPSRREQASTTALP